MKATPNVLIVEIEKQYEDEIQHGSLKLHIDAGFNPTFSLRTYGTVLAIPEGKVKEEGTNNLIDPIIKVGDKIHFHYLATDSEINLLSSDHKKEVRRVFYHYVFAVVRDGELIPCSGWILGKPVIEGGGEQIQVGNQLMRVEMSDSGIITSVNMKKSMQKVSVSHISEYVGIPTQLKKGDICYSKIINMLNFENKIEGESFYCFKEDDVDVVLGNLND